MCCNKRNVSKWPQRRKIVVVIMQHVIPYLDVRFYIRKLCLRRYHLSSSLEIYCSLLSSRCRNFGLFERKSFCFFGSSPQAFKVKWFNRKDENVPVDSPCQPSNPQHSFHKCVLVEYFLLKKLARERICGRFRDGATSMAG